MSLKYNLFRSSQLMISFHSSNMNTEQLYLRQISNNRVYGPPGMLIKLLCAPRLFATILFINSNDKNRTMDKKQVASTCITYSNLNPDIIISSVFGLNTWIRTWCTNEIMKWVGSWEMSAIWKHGPRRPSVA